MLEGIWRRLFPWLIGLCLLGATLLIGGLIIFYSAISPHVQAEEEMTRLARHYAKLSQVSPTMTFHGQETYYSILGVDDLGQPLAILLPEGASQPELIPFGDKLSMADVEQRLESAKLSVDELSLGRYEGRLVWQVKSQLSYYLYDAQSWELIRVWD